MRPYLERARKRFWLWRHQHHAYKVLTSDPWWCSCGSTQPLGIEPNVCSQSSPYSEKEMDDALAGKPSPVRILAPRAFVDLTTKRQEFPPPRCTLCRDPIVWHRGNGGQWLGAEPPRDWGTCEGRPEGPRHRPPLGPPDWRSAS